MTEYSPAGVLGFFIILSAMWYVYGFKAWSRKRIIENTPTSKIRSIAMGLVEIYGKIITAWRQVIKSPFTGRECVYYKYKIEEKRGSGKNTQWITVKQGNKGVPFYVEDETGKVLVDPEGAEASIIKNHYEYKTGTKTPMPELIKKFMEENKIKPTMLGIPKTLEFTEYVIIPKDELFVLGTAADNPYVSEGTAKKNYEDIMITKGKTQKLFYLSNNSEKGVLTLLKLGALGLIIGPIIITLCLAGIFLYHQISWGLTATIAFAALSATTVTFYIIISIFNELVSLKNNIKKSWANIDVLLKQRFDEVPRLVETIKAYTKYEKGLLTELTNIRSEFLNTKTVAEKANAEENLSKTLNTVFSISENYPELKANTTFMHLQERISDLETQIADRREFYNNTVNAYNIRIQTFPDFLIAMLTRYKMENLFKAV